MSAELKKVQSSSPLKLEEDFLMPDLSAFEKESLDWKEKLEQWGGLHEKYHPLGEFKSAHKKTYSVDQLAMLAEDTEQAKDRDDIGRARFVLRNFSSQGLIFAREGAADDEVPSHAEMALGIPVLSAGTVELDENNKIIFIDHKSGGIRPFFESLRPVLEILQVKNLLADSFCIRKVDGSGGVFSEAAVKLADLATLKPLKLNDSAESKLSSGSPEKRKLDEFILSSKLAAVPPSPRPSKKRAVSPRVTWSPSQASMFNHSSPLTGVQKERPIPMPVPVFSGNGMS